MDLEWQKEPAVDDLKLNLALTDFVADFALTRRRRCVLENVGMPSAIKLTVNGAQHRAGDPLIFYQFPDLFEIKDSKFQLIDRIQAQDTGRQIAKNIPGSISCGWVPL